MVEAVRVNYEKRKVEKHERKIEIIYMESPQSLSIEEQVLLLTKEEDTKNDNENVEKIVVHLTELFNLNDELDLLISKITVNQMSTSSFFSFLILFKNDEIINQQKKSFIPSCQLFFDEEYFLTYQYISKSLIEIKMNKNKYYESIIDRFKNTNTLSRDSNDISKSGLHTPRNHNFKPYDFVEYIKILLRSLIDFVESLDDKSIECFLKKFKEYQNKVSCMISSQCKKWCETKRIRYDNNRCISSRCHDLSSFLSNFKRIVKREKNLILKYAVIEDRFNPGNKEIIIEEKCKTRTRKTFLNRRGITNDSTASLIIEVYDEVCKTESCSLTNCFAKLINLERLTDDIFFVEKYIQIVINNNKKYKKLFNLLFFKESQWFGGSKKTHRLRKPMR